MSCGIILDDYLEQKKGLTAAAAGERDERNFDRLGYDDDDGRGVHGEPTIVFFCKNDVITVGHYNIEALFLMALSLCS